MTIPTYTSPEDEEFFGAIGRLTISWAYIECGIDLTVILLHHAFNGRTVEPEIPWSLQRKLKYVRKCIGRQLIAEIEAASEFRHDVIHGFITEHVEGTGEASMMRLLRGGEPAVRKEFSVTTGHVLQQAVVAGKLGGRAMKLAVQLQQIVDMALEKRE